MRLPSNKLYILLQSDKPVWITAETTTPTFSEEVGGSLGAQVHAQLPAMRVSVSPKCRVFYTS